MRKIGVTLAVLASMVFAGTASAHGKRHYWNPTPTPPPVVVVPSVQVNRSGTCVNGVFTNLTTNAFNYGANTIVAVPAFWVQGLGETCDNPVALGYKAAGYNVSDAGTIDTAAPQFNVYPYYVK